MERSADSLQTRWSQIERMHGRDADAAWMWFVDRYRGFVLGLLTKMTRSRARGVEAAEDFWGYFFQHRIHERADHGRRFRAFLAGVVRRFGLDWSRRAGAGEVSSMDDQQAVLDTVAEDEELRLYARTLIHNALQRLATGETADGTKIDRVASPDASRMLRLFYGIAERAEDPPPETMKASQVAQVLGITIEVNAMHKRMHDARTRLREIVIEEVRETVPSGTELQHELQLVFAAIQSEARGLVE